MRSLPATGAPPGFREIFRYGKGQRTRTYGLKALDDRVSELWVVASDPGPAAANARKLVRVASDDELAVFLEDVEQQLRRGRWSPMC
jgi:hypothetical protein